MSLVRFVGCWAIAGLLSFPLAAILFFGEGGSLEFALALHFLSAVVLFWAVPRGKGWWHMARPWALPVVMMAFLLPGMGWALAGIFFMAGWRHPEANVPPEERPEAVTLPHVADHTTREGRIVKELDFLPLVEILAGGDMDLKRGAIEQLARLKTPEAIRSLLDHRSDSSLEVRYYVNAALARIKKEIDEDLDAARHQIQLDVYKLSARVFLAKTYLHYARSGLLDEGLSRSYEDEALFHLTFVVDSPDATEESFRLLVHCLVANQDWVRATAVIDRAMALKRMSPEEGARHRVEVAYHQHRFAEIPQELKAVAKGGHLSPDWQTAVLWWGAQP